MIVKKCRGIVITHPIMDHPTRILCIIFAGEGNYQNPTAFPLTLVYPSVEYSYHSFRWVWGVLLRLHLFVIAKAHSVEILLDRALKLYSCFRIAGGNKLWLLRDTVVVASEYSLSDFELAWLEF